MATESYSSPSILMQYYGNKTKPGAHIPFNFFLLNTDRNNFIGSIDLLIETWLENIPENMVPNWVVSIQANNIEFEIIDKLP